MDIQRPLQPFSHLGVGVCSSSKGAVATTGSGVLPLQMIGMDLLITDVLHGFWMFGLRSLVLGPLRSPFVLLAAFILDSDFDPFGQYMPRASPLPGFQDLRAQFKQGLPVPTFTI
ncbi:hypothetical protein ASN18_2574 [Candidatus Magnetominusculus xianensis]|uniref:Uncharacterized protein n=1 Tax=Candidatus Magnetominusculus xianensis TaxID=1748249 RepID=A0ABR5SEN6_9BACT|nr:hypothetical protein ASN18_2574 [Candidatus Magnetominusculus xianensis]